MSFWDLHGIWGGLFFCLMCAFLPRLTLVFLSMLTGAIGITFWGVMGWILAPRLLIAIIATTIYWHTNPILCVFAWMCAFGGESGEKCVCVNKSRR